jgi:hypothetical protein
MSLRRGLRKTLFVDTSSLAYARHFAGESSATVINLADMPRSIDLPGAWPRLALATDPGCALQVLGGITRAELPARSGMILEG